MQHLETCLLIDEAGRVLCRLVMFFIFLLPLDLENEIRLLSRFFYYSWLVCLLGFWLRNAPLVKVIGNRISDGSLSKMSLLTSPFLMRKMVEKFHAILALLDGLQGLHLDW